MSNVHESGDWSAMESKPWEDMRPCGLKLTLRHRTLSAEQFSVPAPGQMGKLIPLFGVVLTLKCEHPSKTRRELETLRNVNSVANRAG